MATEDWKDRRIAELEAQLAAALATIVELKAQVEKLSRTSRNSSKPPSSDPPGTPKRRGKKGKRRRGGQPGHKGHRREFLVPDEVKHVVPQSCGNCGKGLSGVDPSPQRRQVVDVPPILPKVTDYLCHCLKCWRCGAWTEGTLPVEARGGLFGPRLSAMIAICTGKYRLSKRGARELMSDFLGVGLSVGSVSNIERRIGAALEAPVTEAEAHVRAQHTVHIDETGWREDKKKAWLWVAATTLVAVFRVATSRGADIAKQLLGADFAGTAVSDRWVGYRWLDTFARQLCWSHLIRDFQSWVDAEVEIGSAILLQAKRMFRLWHRVRDGTMTREAFIKQMRPIQVAVGALLTDASRCGHRRTEGMAKQILKLEAALWTFVHVEGVEPTNNFGERTLRGAVLWRKACFGNDSPNGSRFAERILSTVATLRLQRRNALEFITEAYLAHLGKKAAPSLLPRLERVEGRAA